MRIEFKKIHPEPRLAAAKQVHSVAASTLGFARGAIQAMRPAAGSMIS
jgi:hypothetical protein